MRENGDTMGPSDISRFLKIVTQFCFEDVGGMNGEIVIIWLIYYYILINLYLLLFLLLLLLLLLYTYYYYILYILYIIYWYTNMVCYCFFLTSNNSYSSDRQFRFQDVS